MVRRLPRAQFEKQKGEANKQAMKALVYSGPPPGFLALSEDQPIGWCSLGPRAHYPSFQKSRVLKAVDDQPVWSVVCFFVKKEFRHLGLTVALLHAVIDYAREQGATLLEGYPIHPKKDTTPSVFAYPGLLSAYLQAGFHEVLRRSETRPIVRLKL